MANPVSVNLPKVGWRINEWYPAVGCGRSFTCELIAKGEIESVRIAGMRIITTAPSEFINRLKTKEAA